jgi:hypothetical protein
MKGKARVTQELLYIASSKKQPDNRVAPHMRTISGRRLKWPAGLKFRISPGSSTPGPSHNPVRMEHGFR